MDSIIFLLGQCETHIELFRRILDLRSQLDEHEERQRIEELRLEEIFAEFLHIVPSESDEIIEERAELQQLSDEFALMQTSSIIIF